MDVTLSDIVFGGCFIIGGAVLIFLTGKRDYKSSMQRLNREKEIFCQQMRILDIPAKETEETYSQFTSLRALAKANRELRKGIKKSNLIHDSL